MSVRMETGRQTEQRDEAISHRVIEMVAAEVDTDPVELPPLYETIDPEALDALFASSFSHGPLVGQVAFTYGGCEITVSYDDELVITVEEQPSP